MSERVPAPTYKRRRFPPAIIAHLDAERIQRHHVKRLQQLGYGEIILTPMEAA